MGSLTLKKALGASGRVRGNLDIGGGKCALVEEVVVN